MKSAQEAIIYYGVQYDRPFDEIASLTFNEVGIMVDAYNEKFNQKMEDDLVYHLYLVRKLAFSTMQFFPERVRGKLKETDFYHLPYDDVIPKDKVKDPEAEIDRLKNRFNL